MMPLLKLKQTGKLMAIIHKQFLLPKMQRLFAKL